MDSRVPFLRPLLTVWLVTAAWDAVCATGLSVFAYGSTAAALWRGVATTALGSSGLTVGPAGVVAGLLVHMTVALTWSALFVAAARVWPALRRTIRSRGGAFAIAALYGPAIWLVMSLVVIPLAAAVRLPLVGAARGARTVRRHSAGLHGARGARRLPVRRPARPEVDRGAAGRWLGAGGAGVESRDTMRATKLAILLHLGSAATLAQTPAMRGFTPARAAAQRRIEDIFKARPSPERAR